MSQPISVQDKVTSIRLQNKTELLNSESTTLHFLQFFLVVSKIITTFASTNYKNQL